MFAKFTRAAWATLFGFVLTLHSASAEDFAPARSPTTPASPNERHFVVLLAHQSADNAIELSHTFAVFVRTTDAASRQPRVAETFTISWLPAAGVISVAHPAEPGINKSLGATLAWAEERGLQVTLQGPFEIQPELFQRAARQADRLNRGELKYKVFDRFGRDTAKSCIHALADIVEDHGRLNSGAKRGAEATELVVRHFRPFFVSENVPAEADRLLDSLHLRRYAAIDESLVAAGGNGRLVP